MKKIDAVLLSLVIVGTSFGETNDQHVLMKKVHKEKFDHSVEALVNKMRALEVEKEKAGDVSDTVCKTFVPWRCGLAGGIVTSLTAMLFYASDFHFFQKKIKVKLEDQLTTSEVMGRGMLGFIFGSVGTWVVAKILFGLSEARRIKTKVKKIIEQQHQPEIKLLKENIQHDLTNISSDEKNELIAHLERDCGLQYKHILK